MVNYCSAIIHLCTESGDHIQNKLFTNKYICRYTITKILLELVESNEFATSFMFIVTWIYNLIGKGWSASKNTDQLNLIHVETPKAQVHGEQ